MAHYVVGLGGMPFSKPFAPRGFVAYTEPIFKKAGGMNKIFELFLIKPSHYDNDGYVIQWLRSAIPANTLAAMNGLALDCAARRVLGEDVEMRITTWDETNTRIRADRIIRRIRECG